jgi:NitT/TauT family transport system substrate-binding protein
MRGYFFLKSRVNAPFHAKTIASYLALLASTRALFLISMKISSFLRFSLAALAASTLFSHLSAAPLRIAVSTWVGAAPYWIIQKKNLLEGSGVQVEFVRHEALADGPAMLARGEVDLACMATNDAVVLNAEKPIGSIVMFNDASWGADCIMTTAPEGNDSLKGQRVGLELKSLSHYFLNKVMRRQKLADADVTLVACASQEGPKLMSLGQVDAIVSYEPFASEAKLAGARLLVSTATFESGLTDSLVARNDVLKTRENEIRAVVAAWYQALSFIEKNREEAFAIMARGIGAPPQDFEGMWSGVKMYDEAANQKLFTAEGGTLAPAYQQVNDISLFLESQGLIPRPISARTMVNSRFVLAAPATPAP